MPDIRHAIQISAMPKDVFPLVSTGPGWAQWWAADVTDEAGTLEVGFFNRQTLYRMRALVDEAPTRSQWFCETGAEWTGTRLLFHLNPADRGTLLRFTHADWRAETDYFVSCNTTWGELMFRLKAAAEGKSHGPLFLASGMAY